MKLLYHECLRNFGDRLVMRHDREWLYQTLKEVCRNHFYVVDQLEDVKQLEADIAQRNAERLAEKRPSTISLKSGDAASFEGGSKQGEIEELDPKRKDQFLWPINDPIQLFYSTWN